MKRAAGDHNLRHILNKPPPRYSIGVTLQNVAGFLESEILLEPGISIICGPNGSGKSTVLRAAYACLTEDWLQTQPALQRKFVASKFTVRRFDGEPLTTELDLSTTPPTRIGNLPSHVYYKEPSSEVPYLQKFLSEVSDLDDIIKTLEPKIFTAEEIGDVSYSVGKDYSKVELFELDDWDDKGVIPYFRVEIGDLKYSSDGMGLGEFSLFFMYWWLNSAQPKSILFIEEPESFISPKSQRALVDILSKYAKRKQLSLVVSTHSPSLVERIPHNNIRVLLSDGISSRAVTPEGIDAALASLGMTPQIKGVFFVEDRAAHYLLEGILAAFAPSLLAVIRIVRAGSNSDVTAALNKIPLDGHPFIFAGILDGDQRNKGHQTQRPLSYLPGEVSPGTLMMEYSRSHRNELARQLGMSREIIDVAIQNNLGSDEHDWAADIARSLGLQESLIFMSMARIWAAEQLNNDSCLQQVNFVAEVLAGTVSSPSKAN